MYRNEVRGDFVVVRRCSVFCPFFRCARKCMIKRQMGRKRLILCSLTGDLCIGAKCTYATCTRHALLPNGMCALTMPQRTKVRSIEEEVVMLDHEYSKLKDKLKKLGKDIDLI